jgi:hypothetical protein
MIDLIKFTLPVGLLDKCERLKFQNTVEETGEEGEWKTAQYDEFEIRVNNRTGWNEVKGSLHKYWSKSHNGGPFPRWAVAQAMQQLGTALGFDPAQAKPNGFEFGANVPMPTPAKELLRRAVQFCKKGGAPKPLNTKYSEQGLMREVVAEQYYGKLYDKEDQLTAAGYPAPGLHLLRVEVKVRKMQLLHKAGVKTLADLASPAALELMGELLLKHLNSILFAVPGTLPPTLRTSQRQLLRDGATVGYWDRLAKQPQLRVQVRQYRIAAQLVPDAALDAATQGLRSVWQQLLYEPAPALSLATVAEPNTIQLYPQYRGLTWNKEKEEAAPSQTAEGLLARSPCLPASLPADDEREQPMKGRGPDIPNRYTSSSPHDDDEREPMPPAARCCLTCGAPIASHRKPETRYCGKKCKNAASNPLHNARRAVNRILSLSTLFDQRPFLRIPEPIRAAVLAAAA